MLFSIADSEYIVEHNRELFNKTNRVWNWEHFNKTDCVGYTMMEIRNLEKSIGEFPSLFDWTGYYFENVRTTEQIMRIATDFKKSLEKIDGIILSDEQAVAFVIYRAIVQTYYGREREVRAKQYLIQNYYPEKDGYSVVESDEIQDRRMGIDLIVYHQKNSRAKTKAVALWQIKPASSILNRDSVKLSGRGWKRTAIRNGCKQMQFAFQNFPNTPYNVIWDVEDKWKTLENIYSLNDLPFWVKYIAK